MSHFTAKYTDEQRAAVVHAALDLKVKPQARICDMAAAGTLELHGQPVPAFTITAASVSDVKRTALRRRQGTDRGGLTDTAHRDAVDALRKRLIALTDSELSRLEIKARRKGEQGRIPGSDLRELARALRELALVPDRDQVQPLPVGKAPTATGKPEDPRTRGGLAGQLLTDMRDEQRTAHDPEPDPLTTSKPQQTTEETETTEEPRATTHPNTQPNTTAPEPGLRGLRDLASARGAGVRAAGDEGRVLKA